MVLLAGPTVVAREYMAKLKDSMRSLTARILHYVHVDEVTR